METLLITQVTLVVTEFSADRHEKKPKFSWSFLIHLSEFQQLLGDLKFF